MSNTYVPALTKPKFTGRLRYGAASLNFTAATASVGSYVFTANGLYDPNITGGSLSPAGFAQLIGSYEHYTVSHAKITVVFTNNGTTPAMVGIALEPDVSGSTDVNNMLELPYEQLIQLEPSTAYGASKTLSMSVNLSKYFGENVLRTTNLYRGDAVSNPTEQAYFHCKAFAVKGGTADIYITVKIEYTAVFTEPRELSPSLQASILRLVVAEQKERERREGVVLVSRPDSTNCR